MAANYGALKAQVATYLSRADLTVSIPDFISGALARINLELQAVGGIVDQEQVATALTVSGQDSLPVPADYQALRYIKLTYNNCDDILETVSYDQLIDTYNTLIGTPEQVAIFDDAFYFRPIPNVAATVQIGYIKRYTDFAADTDTNYLLTNGGNLLLYATCLEATPQLQDDGRMPGWAQLYKEAMRLLIAAAKRSERGPKPAGARMDAYLVHRSLSSILNG